MFSGVTLIFAAMNKIAVFFFIIFAGFIVGPTLVTYIDKNADVSIAFTANEEENSAKNHEVSEFTIQDYKTDMERQFLLSKSSIEHYYQKADQIVFLEVTSPPPKHI